MHAVHRIRRNAINPFFSRAAVQRLEPLVQQRVKQMSDKFGDYVKSGRLVPVRDAFVATTIDIVTQYGTLSCRGSNRGRSS